MGKRFTDVEIEQLEPKARNRILWRRAHRSKPHVRAKENEKSRIAMNARYTPELGRDHKMKSTYGITQSVWQDLLASQNYKCACCGFNDPGSVYGWTTDHDDDLKKIRGIVCQDCNIALGVLGDDLESAKVFTAMYLSYLSKPLPELNYSHPVRKRPSAYKRKSKRQPRRNHILSR